MNRTDVPIATPCQVDWSSMTLADQGRFCGTCRKVVRELAQLTEGEARALLASPPTEGLCVRYLYDERGEIVFRRDVVPVARLRRRAAVLAMAVAIPMSSAACGSQGIPSYPATVPSRLETLTGAPPMPETPVTVPDGGNATAPITAP
jgi:hypothetical protein